jgi:pimeloyl-ACP methyl ester carboxylesterase
MGSRQLEGATAFYRRFPHSSRLGAMVGEVAAAIDFVRCASPAAAAEPRCADGAGHTPTYKPLAVPALDDTRVHLLGYSLGAMVALHAAALLPPTHVAGVAAFGGWTPMRAPLPSAGGNGLLSGRGTAQSHALLPRLGAFDGDPASVPYDYDELLAALAPRPVLLYAPLRNRFASAAAVQAAADAARASWVVVNATTRFEVRTPDAPSDFRGPEVGAALDWVERMVLGG